MRPDRCTEPLDSQPALTSEPIEIGGRCHPDRSTCQLPSENCDACLPNGKGMPPDHEAKPRSNEEEGSHGSRAILTVQIVLKTDAARTVHAAPAPQPRNPAR